MSARNKSKIRNQKSETVLFAVTGMSPAILTETVWALAHEKPAIIPNRVVVVTTRAGREAVQRELFTGKADGGKGKGECVWEQLRATLAASRLPLGPAALRFGTTADDIKVFTRADARGRSIELDDIRTPADNEAAADFLLDALRPFTENEDVRLVCSLAGGRKTMGSLLYACLSLIGRDQDRLTHVLVNEPFDHPRLEPRFYFPTTPPTQHRCPRITNHESRITASSSHTARIELADVPFVPLRKLFPRELGRLPGRFMNLVQQYRATVDQLAAPPRVEFDDSEPVVRVDGISVRLPATALALLDFLVRRARAGEPPWDKWEHAIEPFQGFVAGWGKGCDAFHFRNGESVQGLRESVDNERLRKLVNHIKTGLARAGVPNAAAAHLVPRKHHFGVRIAS